MIKSKKLLMATVLADKAKAAKFLTMNPAYYLNYTWTRA